MSLPSAKKAIHRASGETKGWIGPFRPGEWDGFEAVEGAHEELRAAAGIDSVDHGRPVGCQRERGRVRHRIRVAQGDLEHRAREGHRKGAGLTQQYPEDEGGRDRRQRGQRRERDPLDRAAPLRRGGDAFGAGHRRKGRLLGQAKRGGHGAVRDQRGDEAIAAPVDGLDVGRLLRIVAEDLPELADGLGQRGVGDEGVLPDGVQQRLLRDDATRAGDEVLEDAEDAKG